jgi:hypothetical protein
MNCGIFIKVGTATSFMPLDKNQPLAVKQTDQPAQAVMPVVCDSCHELVLLEAPLAYAAHDDDDLLYSHVWYRARAVQSCSHCGAPLDASSTVEHVRSRVDDHVIPELILDRVEVRGGTAVESTAVVPDTKFRYVRGVPSSLNYAKSQKRIERIYSDSYRAWIFVSHASDDIERVREVRNYLESKGASPLLFYLKALAEPEEFWPIIEREIAARNFFLYCHSTVAEEREWVRRERAAVEAASRKRPIRVDSIRVDDGDLDFTKLDAFLTKTRVFPIFSWLDNTVVDHFVPAMERAGFQVFLEDRDMIPDERWYDVIDRELKAAARDGWVVPFISHRSMSSQVVDLVVSAGVKLGAKFIPVVIDDKVYTDPRFLSYELGKFNCLDATHDPGTAPDRLVELMLRR